MDDTVIAEIDYKKEIDTEIIFPNITVYRLFANGELYGYEVVPIDGYVMYNPNDNVKENNKETGEKLDVIYYRKIAVLPKNYNFNNFPYISTPRNGVDENYVF